MADQDSNTEELPGGLDDETINFLVPTELEIDEPTGTPSLRGPTPLLKCEEPDCPFTFPSFTQFFEHQLYYHCKLPLNLLLKLS